MFLRLISHPPHRIGSHPGASSARQRSKSHLHGRPPNQVHLGPSGWAGAAARSVNDSACSRNNPIEDDLVMLVGARGRGKGEFTNPQGIAVAQNGELEDM